MIEFAKKNTSLNLTSAKNKLGDEVIGYNRIALSRYEKIDVERAEEWLNQDIEKARKFASKFGLDKHEPVIFFLFYIGHSRWKEVEGILKLIKHGEYIKATLILTNHRFIRNNPSLGGILGTKIVKDDRTL